MIALAFWFVGMMTGAFLVLFGQAERAPLPILAGMSGSIVAGNSKRWSEW